MSLRFENPDEPPTLTVAQAPSSIGDVFSANKDASEYAALSWGKRNAMVDATEKRVKAIKEATGQEVQNPYQGGFLDEAMNAYAKENPRFRSSPLDPATDLPPSPYRSLRGEDMPRINQLQIEAFQKKLDELEGKFPDKASIIGAKRPISQDAIELANTASARAASVNSATTGFVPATAAFLGSMVGSFRDPMQVGALFVAPELGAAQSVLGKVAMEGLRQAAVNAGVSAMSQPGVQQWRAERGQESGVIPAIEDVGMNALFGLVPGMGIEAGKLGVEAGWSKYASPVLARRAMAGDEDAARELATSIPKDAAPELHAAAESVRLDDAAKGTQPPPLAEDSYVQAVRRAEDVAEPLPEIARPGGQEEVFAALGERGRDMVREGEVSPTIAAEVGSRVVDPADQASIMREVAELKPTTKAEAAQFTSDAMDRKALPLVQKLALGADIPEPRAGNDNLPQREESFSRRTVEAPEKETEISQRLASLEQTLKDVKSPDDPQWAGAAAARDELVNAEPREGLFANIVAACPEEEIGG